MKKSLIIGAGLLLTLPVLRLQAQVTAGAEGIHIKSGTVFSTEGVSLIPETDLVLTGLKLERQPRSISWPDKDGISSIFNLSKSIQFQGAISFRYNSSDLNGNNEGKLSFAYSSLPYSVNHKDYTLSVPAKNQLFDRSISQVFPVPINLSSITAVSREISSELQVSNLVSPNGDGINDLWVIKGILDYPQNELKIFDREGRVVFSANGYKNTWDTHYNGNPLPEDTYYYVLYLDPEKTKLTGFISVIHD